MNTTPKDVPVIESSRKKLGNKVAAATVVTEISGSAYSGSRWVSSISTAVFNT
jgi:hypothetical protein